MKHLLLALLILPTLAIAQTGPLTAPEVAGCPSPVPPSWPASSCKFAWYPLTDTVHAVSSSKGTPLYQHTLQGYIGAKWTGTILACPAGATVNGQACTDSAGKDVSAAITLAQLSSFSIAPPAGPVTKVVTLTWSAPTSNVDQTPVTAGELTGFNIYAQMAGQPINKIGSTAAAVTTYITQPLGVGTYTFTVTAVAGSQESAPSGAVTINIAGTPPPPPVPQSPANVTGVAK